jgi:tetratricopeptide (TPR) repeat protein
MNKINKINKIIKNIESLIINDDVNNLIKNWHHLLAIDPNNYVAYLQLGNCLSRLKKFEEALVFYIKAESISNNNSVILNNIGLTYLFLNNYIFAEKYMLKSIEADPENFQPYINLGSIYDSQAMHQENLNISIKAISKWPRNEILHLNLGVALMGMNLIDEAKISFETALILKPGYLEAELNLASVYTKIGDNDFAVSIYENFITKNATKNHERIDLVKYYLSYEYLSRGDLRSGWEFYKSGFNHLIPSYLKRRPDRKFHVPLWDIEFSSSDKILVWSEQGLGDELMFATMLPDQIKITPNLIFECDHRLVPIFSRTYPDITVREHSYDQLNFYKQKLQDFNHQIPIANLCCIHRDNISKFPIKNPILKVDPEIKKIYQDRLCEFNGKILIGICWRSGVMTPARNSAYTSILDWKSIFSIPNASFINLQYGECEDEIRKAEEKFNVQIIRWNDLDLKNDLDNVMGLIDCLDYIVTAGTAVLSMAGSLGKKTFVFLNKPTWIMLGANNYPWFNSVTPIFATDKNITATALEEISNEIKKGIEQLNPFFEN